MIRNNKRGFPILWIKSKIIQCDDCRFIPIEGAFCFEEKCPYFVGLEESKEYKKVLLRYYELQLEENTEYVRSDYIRDNDDEICGLPDRVWKKIDNIKESTRGYCGQYMNEYIFYHLRDNDKINYFDPEDFRDMLREQRYVISKSSFNRYWNIKIEEHTKWKNSLTEQDVLLRNERNKKEKEREEKRLKDNQLSARLSINFEEMRPRKYFF
jgi:hypothetical protein